VGQFLHNLGSDQTGIRPPIYLCRSCGKIVKSYVPAGRNGGLVPTVDYPVNVQERTELVCVECWNGR
jgi:hypothetical protein